MAFRTWSHFGALPDGRRFMVRELVEGMSFEELLETERDFLGPLAIAADTLTALHRAGLLHGDVKPANIVVEPGGRATLVDLGLAAPWREGGTRPQGLTPRYAAPELLVGEPLTVRAEVYALGATLKDALEAREKDLPKNLSSALRKVATRATEEAPEARYPSIDELASALRSSASLPARGEDKTRVWPVLGIDAASHDLSVVADKLAPGAAVALVGPPKSGRSTLLRRLAWTRGVGGEPVVMVESPADDEGTQVLAEEIREASKRRGLLVVDDLARMPAAIENELKKASEAGARIVAAADASALSRVTLGAISAHEMPRLDANAARELVTRAIPSLGAALVAAVIERANGSPGVLRAILGTLGVRAVVSVEELTELLAHQQSVVLQTPLAASPEDTMLALTRTLNTGRFDEASDLLAVANLSKREVDAIPLALAAAKIALARGDTKGAEAALDGVRAIAVKGREARAFNALVARVKNRSGDFAGAAELAKTVIDGGGDDAISSDAHSVRGVALAYVGNDDEARKNARARRQHRRKPRGKAGRSDRPRLARDRASARRPQR